MNEFSNQGSKNEISSKFLLVIAAAKRSKQIASEAKAKGLSPNEVARVKTKFVKPPTLALEELKAGKIRYSRNKSLSGESGELEPKYQSNDSLSDIPDTSLESLSSDEIELGER